MLSGARSPCQWSLAAKRNKTICGGFANEQSGLQIQAGDI
jgi:hypothetical protein